MARIVLKLSTNKMQYDSKYILISTHLLRFTLQSRKTHCHYTNL